MKPPFRLGEVTKDHTPTVVDADNKVVCLVLEGDYLAKLIIQLLNEREAIKKHLYFYAH